MDDKTGRRESRQSMTTVTTLKEGVIDIDGPDADQIRAKYGRAYYRDKHGSLRRLFPEDGK